MDISNGYAGDEVRKEKLYVDPLLHDPKYVVILSIILLMFTIVAFWIINRQRRARNVVLFTGLIESGKTLLFLRLVYSQFKQTFTSMKENSEFYSTSKGVLKIVDLPGHERLRNRFFDSYKDYTKAIVYVIDSVTIQKDIRDVTEFLYTILSDKTIIKNSPIVLILCNKQDQPMAKGCQLIKTLLEKEINLVRMTKSNQLQSVDQSQTSVLYLGKQNKEFEFSHIRNKVEFAECNAYNKDTDAQIDIKSLKSWLQKL